MPFFILLSISLAHIAFVLSSSYVLVHTSKMRSALFCTHHFVFVRCVRDFLFTFLLWLNRFVLSPNKRYARNIFCTHDFSHLFPWPFSSSIHITFQSVCMSHAEIQLHEWTNRSIDRLYSSHSICELDLLWYRLLKLSSLNLNVVVISKVNTFGMLNWIDAICMIYCWFCDVWLFYTHTQSMIERQRTILIATHQSNTAIAYAHSTHYELQMCAVTHKRAQALIRFFFAPWDRMMIRSLIDIQRSRFCVYGILRLWERNIQK